MTLKFHNFTEQKMLVNRNVIKHCSILFDNLCNMVGFRAWIYWKYAERSGRICTEQVQERVTVS
jgi:hypothetical protein